MTKRSVPEKIFKTRVARAQDHALTWPGTYASAGTVNPPAP